MKDIGIKSRLRVREHGEVLTPDWLVKDMCDTIPEEFWNRLDATFLEPSCGTGNFLVEILKRKLKLCKTGDDGSQSGSSIYGVDLLPDNVVETKDRMYKLLEESRIPFNEKEVTIILNLNVQQGNMLTGKKANGNPIQFVRWEKEKSED